MTPGRLKHYLFDYLVDHNKCREQKKQSMPSLQQTKDAVQLRELDPHVAQGVIQGPFEAMAVHKWLQTLEWPC